MAVVTPSILGSGSRSGGSESRALVTNAYISRAGSLRHVVGSAGGDTLTTGDRLRRAIIG